MEGPPAVGSVQVQTTACEVQLAWGEAWLASVEQGNEIKNPWTLPSDVKGRLKVKGGPEVTRDGGSGPAVRRKGVSNPLEG